MNDQPPIVRGRTIQVRVTDDERERIRKRAAGVGMKPSSFMRMCALDGPPERTAGGVAAALDPPQPVACGLCGATKTAPDAPCGHCGRQDRSAGGGAVSAVAETQEQFVDRRTRELHAQGRTTPVARAEAQAEWRQRQAEVVA